jgi:hypothetical protein
MSRQRFCRVCGGWHEPDNWPHNCMPAQQGAQSDLSRPMIIHDGMEPVQSQLDGKMYDSKAALRSTYKQAGVVEVGNDSSVNNPRRKPTPKPDRQAIKKSVAKAMSQAGLGA